MARALHNVTPAMLCVEASQPTRTGEDMKSWKVSSIAIITGATLVISAAGVRADSAPLEDKVKALEQRIAELEGRSAPTGAVAKADITAEALDFLGQTKITGFVSASYMYNFEGVDPTGRLYDSHHDQFMANKFKLALEKSVDFSPTNWIVGYRGDLIFGQDAEKIHSGKPAGSGSFNLGQYGDLEQAYVTVNVPVGNGLKVMAGKMVTMMGVEVIEEVNNPNWSIGNQFMYVENTTQTGLQLQYKLSDKLETDFCFFDGWDVLPDNNTGKSFMGRIVVTPDDKTSLAFLGYGGPEQDGDSNNWRTGAELVASRKLCSVVTGLLQLDYGHEDNVSVTSGPNAEWFAAGLWLTYDYCDKVQLALRGDYLRDKDEVRQTLGKELYSGTVTLNIKPVANLQVRPEIRWDRSTNNDAYNGKHGDQVTALIGVAYLY
jgi:hypothetical protein